MRRSIYPRREPIRQDREQRPPMHRPAVEGFRLPKLEPRGLANAIGFHWDFVGAADQDEARRRR